MYEVDRKCVAKHLPRGADAAYLRDVLSDAFGPLASVEVAPGDVAYVVFERSEDAAAAAATRVRVRSGAGERPLDCEPSVPRRGPPRGAAPRAPITRLLALNWLNGPKWHPLDTT